MQQEQVHFKQELDTLQQKIDDEVEVRIGGGQDSDVVVNKEKMEPEKVRELIEKKHSASMTFLLNSLRRAIKDE